MKKEVIITSVTEWTEADSQVLSQKAPYWHNFFLSYNSHSHIWKHSLPDESEGKREIKGAVKPSKSHHWRLLLTFARMFKNSVFWQIKMYWFHLWKYSVLWLFCCYTIRWSPALNWNVRVSLSRQSNLNDPSCHQFAWICCNCTK